MGMTSADIANAGPSASPSGCCTGWAIDCNRRAKSPRRPQWLTDAHQALDGGVEVAYGRDAGVSEDEALRKLLALNRGWHSGLAHDAYR